MKLFKQTRGLIMMETLITLPIYIVMLAGLFWLGETALVRLVMVDGENFTLWQAGNRHGGSGAPYIFWFLDNTKDGVMTAKADIKSNSFTPNSNAYGWGETNSGRLVGRIKRSVWSLGAGEAVRTYFTETSGPEPAGKEFADILGKSGDLKIFSRAGDGSRAGSSSYDGSTVWHSIALGSWDGLINPDSSGSSYSISAYNRNGSYVGWSE